MATAPFQFNANALASLETDVPKRDVLTITNVKISVASFDDTTQQYLNGSLDVPADIDTSGSVTIRVKGTSRTAAASKNVAFDFNHTPVDATEDIDSASYTTEASGDKATQSTQNALEEHSWSETVTNLGWAVGDQVYFRISRKAAAANNLTGDWDFHALMLDIPLA